MGSEMCIRDSLKDRADEVLAEATEYWDRYAQFVKLVRDEAYARYDAEALEAAAETETEYAAEARRTAVRAEAIVYVIGANKAWVAAEAQRAGAVEAAAALEAWFEAEAAEATAAVEPA